MFNLHYSLSHHKWRTLIITHCGNYILMLTEYCVCVIVYLKMSELLLLAALFQTV